MALHLSPCPRLIVIMSQYRKRALFSPLQPPSPSVRPCPPSANNVSQTSSIIFHPPSFRDYVSVRFQPLLGLSDRKKSLSALPQLIKPDEDATPTPFTDSFDHSSAKHDISLHPFPDTSLDHGLSPYTTHHPHFVTTADPTTFTPLSTQRPFPSPRQDKLSPALVFFEVLGALFFLGFAVGITRCLYSYKKTPNRDRIAGLLNRHWWHTQMEELAIQQASMPTRYSLPPPPPPDWSPPPA
jgi:hypothetical protein